MVSKTTWIAVIVTAVVAIGIGLVAMGTQASNEAPESENELLYAYYLEPFSNFALSDLDGDGIANCEDVDDDADGINDTADEYPHDHDNDGLPDCRDDDDDNDGIPDTEDDEYVGNCPEARPRLGRHHRMRFPGMFTPFRPASSDLDSDGIANCEDADDDGDGINDTADEYPHDHDNDGIPDGRDDDDDNDGIPDAEDDYYVGNCSAHGPDSDHKMNLNRPFGPRNGNGSMRPGNNQRGMRMGAGVGMGRGSDSGSGCGFGW